MKRWFLTGFVVVTTAMTAAFAADPVAYPDGYRGWTHVKSMVILPGHALADPFAGLHHVYANEAAVAGLKGGAYADGAQFVFDLHEAQTADKAIAAGPRKFIGVMRRDQAKYAATGGWGYEAFAGDSRDQRVVTDGGVSCHACHEAAKETGYVYSKLEP